ncbi:Carbohydrate-binding, CenC-like [uncultured Caudovirales phage]|uniref:Carbohydrate-binding, CenC-like n=1 Tax=uncultured Caudovirales phage TaxID=2100421 RepID=A0A6J5N5G8_9CAUD|nr:Carbohydrate-binding, CenC-like [uncultured Caudovirales phage]
MAKYGYAKYGTKKYGEVEANRVIYNSNISVFQPDYRTHNLYWEVVTPITGDSALTYWKIVKTIGGAPDSPNDGVVVTGSTFPMGATLSHVDTETIFPAGTELTYSFWVFNDSDWLFCGSADAVVVDKNDDATTLKLARSLPGVWTNSSGSFGDALGEPDTNTDLWYFLNGFGYYYDFLRQKVSVINNMSDYRFFPHAFLPETIVGLGFEYEPSLGDNYHRSLYRSGNIINSLKGSSLGLKIYSTALTHYGSKILQGDNLMLDYNDSSFEESVGRWTTTRTISVHKYENSIDDFSLTLAPPEGILVDTTFPVRNLGFAALSGNNSIPVIMSEDPTTVGIPVKAGTTYLFTGYAQALTSGTSTVSVSAVISWYDRQGTLISSSTSNSTTISSTTVSPQTWYRFLSSSALDENITAPSNAAYALPSFTVTGQTTSGSPVIVDYLSFTVFPGLIGNLTYGSGLEIYEDSRTIKVELEGVRTNYLPNPGFDDGLGGWFPKNSSILPDTSTSYFGSVCCKLIANSTSAGLVSDWIPLNPNSDYIFSAYVKADTAGKKAKMYIEFSSPLDAADQISVTDDVLEAYYNSTPHFVLSDEFTLSTSSFTRISVTSQSPDFVFDGGLPVAKVAIIFTNPEISENYWIDGCLLEYGDALRPYFQGNGAPYPLDPILDEHTASSDLGWETRVRSNFIPNPSFEAASTSGWAGTSAALSSVTASSASIPSKFGTYVLKVIPSGINNNAHATFYYPSTLTPASGDTVAPFPYGGEDIVASAYVYGGAGTYTISIGSYSNSFALPAMTSWYRIHVVGAVNKPTSLTPSDVVTIAYSESSGDWYADGVQVEFGRTPSPFVDPSDTYTVELVNPTNDTDVYYASRRELTGGGRSYYFSRRATKVNRLANTIGKYIPLGSSWSIQVGEPTPELPEITSSLLKSSSFENSLYGWNPYEDSTNTVLTRVVVESELTVAADTPSLGISWVRVENAIVSEDGFGIYQENVPVFGSANYLLSLSSRITSDLDAGTLDVYINWTKLDGSPTETVVGVSTPELQESFPITTPDRWNYFGLTEIVAPSDAAYATIKLKYTPDDRTTTNVVLFDRVIFRQV